MVCKIQPFYKLANQVRTCFTFKRALVGLVLFWKMNFIFKTDEKKKLGNQAKLLVSPKTAIQPQDPPYGATCPLHMYNIYIT